MGNESRNTSERIRGPRLVLGGVGGRQQGRAPVARGGGSPPSCSAPEPPVPRGGAAAGAAGRDPRVEELRRMGIRPEWIKVADTIGFEAFIAAWQVLAAEPLDERGRITVPAMKNYYNFQRNEVIRGLAAAGKKPPEISEILREVHNTEISKYTVVKVIAKMRG